MVNRIVKMLSISLMIKEVQGRAYRGYHLTPTSVALSKSQEVVGTCKSVRRTLRARECKGGLWLLTQVELALPYAPAMLLFAVCTRKHSQCLVEIAALPRPWHHYSLELRHGNNQCVHWRMNGEGNCGTHTVGYLFSLGKEWSFTNCCSMEEPKGHYAKWKKLDTERILHVSFTCRS